MTPKEYLKRIRRLDNAANAAMAQVESIEADITRITPRYGTEPVMAGKASDNANAIVRLMEAKEKCNAAIDKYVDYKTLCIERINLIKDEKCRELLTFRYVQYLSFEETAERMNYAVRQIHRLHGRALVEFGKVMP